MERLILVFVGGGAGACARYLAGVGYGRAFGTARPYLATLCVNVLGGLFMGVLVSALAPRGGAGADRWRLLFGVGVLGGFTTFSTFSLETVLMLQKRAYGGALVYASASVFFSVLALMVGLVLTRRAIGS